jgi:hypothetical protein
VRPEVAIVVPVDVFFVSLVLDVLVVLVVLVILVMIILK